MRAKHMVLEAALVTVFCIILHSGSVQAQTSQPWVTQTKTYTNYQFLSGYGGTLSGGSLLSDYLQSDDFGFPLTQGNYNVTLNSGTFDDRGTIGLMQTTKAGSSCGAPATFTTPVNIPNPTVVGVYGHVLQVQITAQDSCPKNIGWQNVSITWSARNNPCTLTVSSPTALLGQTITITGNFANGTGFQATNNQTHFYNNDDYTKSISLDGVPSADLKTLKVTIPANGYPGSYVLDIPTAPTCNTIPIQIKNGSAGPSNLTASIDKAGKVTLNWSDNSVNETEFDIQRGADATNSTFTPIDSVGPNIASYSYVIGSASIPATNQSYRVRAALPDGTFTDFSNVAQVSNCVALSGSGPLKVVFMRGKSWKASAADFVTTANEAITNGFASIEPFKSNTGKFSFYIDFTQYDDQNMANGNPDDVRSLMSSSACGGGFKQYIVYVNQSVVNIPTAFSAPGLGFSVLNLGSGAIALENGMDQAIIAIHEVGHGFAGLLDEYTSSGGISANAGDLNGLVNELNRDIGFKTAKNCTDSPLSDYRGLDNHYYGSVTDKGCTYLTATVYQYGSKGSVQYGYYRPSINSIMNINTDASLPSYNKFNVISCGYILAAMDGANPLTMSRREAAPYWPQCKAMAVTGSVVADNIAPTSPMPTLTKISKTTLAPGDPTITGTNFSTTPSNTIRLTNALSTSLFYEITELASPDTKTLSFTLPSGIPPGKYDLQVGAFNSDWSKAISVTVVASTTTVKSPPPSPSTPPLYDFGGMYGGSPNNVNPATGALSCPTGYGSVEAYKGQGNPVYSIYECVRAHVAGTDPLYDFGGMFGTTQYIGGPHDLNIATGQTSCPAGYSSALVIGPNTFTDESVSFCYSPYSSGNRFYNYGGMYAHWTTTNASGGIDDHYINNVFTFKPACPLGYSDRKFFSGIIHYCYQPAYPVASLPLNLKLTPLSGSQIKFTWTMTSTSGLTSYTIHDYPSNIPVQYNNQGDVVLHTLAQDIPSTILSYTISGLSPKTAYCYSLKAVALYDVAETKSLCATTLAATIAPVPVDPVQLPIGKILYAAPVHETVAARNDDLPMTASIWDIISSWFRNMMH